MSEQEYKWTVFYCADKYHAKPVYSLLNGHLTRNAAIESEIELTKKKLSELTEMLKEPEPIVKICSHPYDKRVANYGSFLCQVCKVDIQYYNKKAYIENQ